MGVIAEETPNIVKILKIFYPIRFPIEISICFLMAATTEVISSGILVPMATIVREIMRSSTPICVARPTAPLTRNSAPNYNPAILAISISIDTTML